MHEARRTEPAARGGGIPDGLLVALLAFLLGLAVLVWTATGLAALFARGSWPDTVTFTRTPTAVRALIAQPHDIAAAWPDTAPAALSGWGLFWGLFVSQLLILFVLTVFVIGVVARTKARRANPKPPPHPAPPTLEAQGPGDSAPAHLRTADLVPTPPHPAPPTLEPQGPGDSAPANHTAPNHDAYRYGFGYAPRPTATTVTPTVTPSATPSALPSATPQGITYGSPNERLRAAATRIGETEGAALIVTSSPTLWAETKDARAKLGPVLLYDPSHLCDTPARMHWNPAEGCAHRDTAAARAVALLAPVRPQARMDEAVADTAETLLRSWLQAAALDDRPFKQLHRWAQGNSAQDPVRILRTHPDAAAGAAGELESALTAHPERRELALHLTARALSCLTSIHIREACNPNRTDSLTLASFLSEGGSLYVVGESLEDPRTHPGAMPLLTALASHVVEHGRRMAARSSHGRLDPPLSLVLEDVAAVAPIPQLPELLAGDTLPLLALCRSREQARSRWPGADL
ncbi:type VI secretion protein [Streptomyces yangpuensis]|uniref:type VI secretion protein n=1 Tax=Streptomyces yangpuensis TaxID=1648182 RepID=UPI00366986E2